MIAGYIDLASWLRVWTCQHTKISYRCMSCCCGRFKRVLTYHGMFNINWMICLRLTTTDAVDLLRKVHLPIPLSSRPSRSFCYPSKWVTIDVPSFVWVWGEKSASLICINETIFIFVIAASHGLAPWTSNRSSCLPLRNAITLGAALALLAVPKCGLSALHATSPLFSRKLNITCVQCANVRSDTQPVVFSYKFTSMRMWTKSSYQSVSW